MQAIPYTANAPAPSAFGLSLQQRSASIKAVLTRVVSLGPSSSPEVAELQGRCHTLAQESAVLRSQLTTAVSARDRIAYEVEEVTQELRRAEKRLDRLRSETVKATEKPSAKAEEEAEQAKVEAAEAEKKAALQRKQRAEGETVSVIAILLVDREELNASYRAKPVRCLWQPTGRSLEVLRATRWKISSD